MKRRKRSVALILSGIMLLSNFPLNVLAEENQNAGILCEHHPEHTAECGFSEEVQGAHCTYVCETCQQQDNGETMVEWPKAPDLWGGGSPAMTADSEGADEMYGQPVSPVNADELAELQRQSQAAPVQEDPDKQLSVEKDIDGPFTIIYVNGEAYTGGDLEVLEGDNFSYLVSWAPHHEAGTPDVLTWEGGSWFETTLFQVPGLNLKSVSNIPLNINGIRVGEYFLTYDKKTGEMTYKVVFNRYIQFFQPSSMAAYLQGSGKFSSSLTGEPIVNGEDTGSITVNPRPEVPNPPSGGPGGVGWTPAKAPGFSNKIYPFGKGVKWNSSSDPNVLTPEIEWRVTFLEHLQKLQREFLDQENWEPTESEGYVIIEDTLDVNQHFCVPASAHDQKKYGNAPFFLEIPVIVPGTGQIPNSTYGVGNDNYDGPGEIWTLFKGNQFREISGEDAHTPEEIAAVKNKVRETPLTWTVTTDPVTRRQTLLINAGKLGTTDPGEGITWSATDTADSWPKKELQDEIQYCDNKISALQTGQDSPIALLHQRSNTLLNLLNRAVNLQENEAKRDTFKKQVEAWSEDYKSWSDDPNISYLEPLDKEKQDENGNPVWELIRPLPQKALLTDTDLGSCFVNSNGRTIADTEEYHNYILSLDNLQKDQRTYLDHRKEYGQDWEIAKEYYQKALDFYQHDGIYGFVLKVRTESVNNSAGTYSNEVKIRMDDKNWAANDESAIRFSGGIIGNYNLGDILLQKADVFYDSKSDDPVPDIQKVEKDKAGLAGAEFQMYCGSTEPKPPELTSVNQAHFLDRDASINGKTYRYTHTGDHAAGAFQGDINTLVTDDDGKLAVGGIAPGHYHWLVETKAPAGYYLDSEPVQIENKNTEVSYQMLPNVSRSILLEKVDSFSKNPVEGAEFTLYRKSDGEAVSGFVKKNLNGHETYWKADGGKETLKTNAEGRLCVHGLEAGTYVLKETKAAPGYILPEKPEPYEFTLGDKLPEAVEDGYDEDYHYLLTKPGEPLENAPDIASLSLKKTDVGKKPLKDAAFALFRFKGTEAEWEADPDREDMWEIVNITDEQETPYFRTENTTTEITLKEDNLDGFWNGKEVQAVLTDAEGSFSITEIPVGHYSIAEVQTPGPTYQRDFRSFYFTVDGDSVRKDLQLYTTPTERKEEELKNNTLVNYEKKAQIALVKYDENKERPKADGLELEESGGWQYTDKVIKDGSPIGLPGARFKLFMRRGASAGRVNPDPAETTTPELQAPKPDVGYDTCLAVGETDENGVLRLSAMRTRSGGTMAGNGLNPEEYYMMEVKAPEGYLLDQNPIHFSLDEKVFGADSDNPGLVMMAGNTEADYGVRLTKIDEETKDDQTPVTLAGAEFEVKQGDTLLYFTGSNGVYRKAGEREQDAVSNIAAGSDGKLTITGLEAGTGYTFTETKPPRGYKIPDDAPPIVITTPASTQDGRLENGVLFPLNEKQVGNERLKGKVTLHKQAAETGEALSGAEFTLYETIVEVIPPGDSGYDPDHPNATRSYDVEIGRETTDDDGNLTFKDLPWSEYYYIIETKAPEGYLLDQTKHMFSIDENSFDADGQAIPIEYPALVNTKGTLGEALLVKTDAENNNLKLADAHFYLEKYLGTDAVKNEIWVGYGQGMYYTDINGEIHFLLPPGKYKLTEMKAPDGYVLEAMKELFFTIEETQDGSPPKVEYYGEKDCEEGSRKADGTVTNRKGETGVYLRKIIEGTSIPLEGVTFRIYWDFFDGNFTHIKEDVYFIHHGGGNYEYTDNPQASGATVDLKTNSDGEIFVMLPESFIDGNVPNHPDATLQELKYIETAAPDGIELPEAEEKRSGPITPLYENIYKEILVRNDLAEEAKKDLSISVQKTDGKSKLGLEGAEFELYDILELDGEIYEIQKSVGVTDRNGNLTFEKNVHGGPLELHPGITYYLRETKAPEGYVRDETVHEITLDERYLDENLQFKPAVVSLHNYQISGSVRLKKVAEEDRTKKLPGAEFELLRLSEDENSELQWEHYGSERYVTDENGELIIENLPYGSYQLIERAAPLGYLLGDPVPVLTFLIETNGQEVDLGYIANEVDPNPVRDVRVQKVAAEDTGKGLPGAEFALYEQKEDGNYHLRQQENYVTDSAGNFVIERLPVGRYALKEIKAPEGYEIPEEDMTYFAVKVDEREVTLQIENAKSDEEEGTTSLTVQKNWEDNNSEERPDSVTVQLYQNGTAHGKPVELNEKNNWTYTWESLDNKDSWAADEVDVPAGYEKSISRKGDTWIITNRGKPGTPVDPDIPAPVRDVRVQKVAAEDTGKGLPGAEFALYEQKEDGNYELRQQENYVTDSAGNFVIEGLPVGSYALKEIKAPEGYEIPEEDMTYFTVKADEREVTLQIENAKSDDEEGTTSLTVQKNWEDNNSEERPDSVTVQLYQNGTAHGEPVELNEGNGWEYTWESLDSKDSWTVDEVEVPAGYEKSISQKGDTWIITNRGESGTPEEPDDPSIPIEPDDPSTPEEPDDPSTPIEPDDPSTPIEPDDPSTPEEPDDPSTPEEPDDPQTPEEPDDPQTPEEPDDPQTPEEPDDPSTPIEPDDPSTPEAPGASNHSADSQGAEGEEDAEHAVQSGDELQTDLWLTLLCLSVMTICLTGRRIRIHKKQR